MSRLSPCTFSDIHAAYRGVMEDVYFHPEHMSAPRGLPIREIRNYHFVIENPSSDAPKTLDPKRNAVIARYLAKEKKLYVSGTKSAKEFAKASTFWEKIANPDGTINSAYGHLIWHSSSMGNPKFDPGGRMTPWQWAKESLQNDADTRQAVLLFALPEHYWRGNKDQTCTIAGIFHIRDDKLHLTIMMRSQDVFRGFPYDIPWFISLMKKMADELEQTYPTLELGTYTHITATMHMYERDRSAIESMLGINHAASYTTDEYDSIAKIYMEEQEKFYKDHESSSRKVLYETLDRLVPGKVVLDAGCGYGRDADHYQKLGADIYGFDASKELLEFGRKRYPKLTQLSRQLLDRTDYPDNFFDVISSRCAIQHALNIEDVYREWYRILKSSGIIAFAAGHPMMQARFPKDDHNIASIPIYGNVCVVREPAHNMREYFSPTLFSLFDLVAFREKEGPQNIRSGKHVPDFFFMMLRKK